jgi:tryptophanyl-tRNA synthetase
MNDQNTNNTAQSAGKLVSLTGDRPTGALHLGHLAGSLLNRVKIQDTHESFVMIADGQAFTDNMDNRKKVHDAIREVYLDYLAVGLEPHKTTIFLQSGVPELFELTFHFLNLVTVARLERNPTVRAEIKQKFDGAFDSDQIGTNVPRDIPAGFLVYPVSQAADIMAFNADVVPVGTDQLPMIEQAQEIADKLNTICKMQVLKKPRAVLSDFGRLPGIDGKAKMSKSLGNSLALGASEDEIKQAVKMMYTDPGHIKVSDPGKIEGNVVFAYLDAFHPDKPFVEELKAHYQRGGLGDRAVKDVLQACLLDMLGPIRERRFEAEKLNITDMLMHGTDSARRVARETTDRVREALGLGF